MQMDYKNIPHRESSNNESARESADIVVGDPVLEFTGNHFDIARDFTIFSDSPNLEIRFPHLRNGAKNKWNPDVKITVSGALDLKLVNPLPCKLRYRGMETSTFREGSVSFTYPEWHSLYSHPDSYHRGYDPDTSKMYTYDSYPLFEFDIPKHAPSTETMIKLMFDNFGRSGRFTMPNEALGVTDRHKWSISSKPVFK